VTHPAGWDDGGRRKAVPDAVVWFRRHLRLSDNPALLAVTAHAGPGGARGGGLCLSPRPGGPSGPTGARFLLRHLVDGDLASNCQGWQWVAAPAPTRHRTFGSSTNQQAERFDSDGTTSGGWVAKLRSIAGRAVDHALERPEPAPLRASGM